MTVRSLLRSAALLAACAATVAQAETITYFTDSVSTTDASELGRASRSGVSQTWTGQESYTGQVNTGTTYYYKTYTFAASNFAGAPYVDVSVFDENNTGIFFVSAFAGSYDPSNRGANWLGDEGASGNYYFYTGDPGDPRDFDVILPANEDLVLLVNTTGGGSVGTNQLYDIAVNAYADTSYDDPMAVTPEPGTLLTTMTGLLGAVGLMRRRFAARA